MTKLEKRLHALYAEDRRMSDALAVEGKKGLPRAEWLALKAQRDAVREEIREVREKLCPQPSIAEQLSNEGKTYRLFPHTEEE